MSDQASNAALDELIGSLKSAVAPFRNVLQDIHGKYKDVSEGRIADYIPELALANPAWFGISVVTPVAGVVA